MISEEILVKAAYELDQAILDSLPDPKECDHNFSPAFEHKMKKLIRRANHFTAYTVLKRVACIFIALLLAASMLLAVNPEARAAFIGWIEDKVDDFYHYFYAGEQLPEETNTSTEAGNVEENRSYYLEWVPEGYVLLDSFETNNGEAYLYANDSNQMIQFTYRYGENNQEMLVGGGEYEQKHITQEDLHAEVYLTTKEGESNIIAWSSEDEDDLLFTITAFVDENDLIKMAQSLATK